MHVHICNHFYTFDVSAVFQNIKDTLAENILTVIINKMIVAKEFKNLKVSIHVTIVSVCSKMGNGFIPVVL